MKLGVKEFRERFSELAAGEEPVLVTKSGQVIGRYVPLHVKPAEKIDTKKWLAAIEERQAEWKAKTPDWKQRMAAYGLGPDGELLPT
jgi:antitoxin (DNA-binding transcriptional repressor) of toxin-antitoxin stability system